MNIGTKVNLRFTPIDTLAGPLAIGIQTVFDALYLSNGGLAVDHQIISVQQVGNTGASPRYLDARNSAIIFSSLEDSGKQVSNDGEKIWRKWVALADTTRTSKETTGGTIDQD